MSNARPLHVLGKAVVARCSGFKAIAHVFNREGVPTPRAKEWSTHYGGHWTLSSVRGILLNPVYGGDMVWNRRTDARFHRIVQGVAVERKGVTTRRLEWNDERDWLVVPGAHEALVPRRLWLQARQFLQSKPESQLQQGINPRTGLEAGEPEIAVLTNGGPKSRFLLSGLIVCPRCGNKYEGRINYGKRSRDERAERKKTYVYGCGGHIRKGRSVCTLGAVPQPALERAVVGAVVKFYEPMRGEDAVEKIAAMLRTRSQSDADSIEVRRSAELKRLRKLDAKVRSLLDNITARNRELADRRIEELDRERESIARRIEALDQQAMSSAEIDDVAAEICDFIKGLERTIRDAR